MKTTKKLTIVTMALMLAFVFAFSNARAAYTPVTPDTGSKGHTLHLENNAEELPAGEVVKYTFTVGTPTVLDGDIKNVSAAVSGAPTIAEITYDDTTAFTNHASSKTLNVDWSGVTFSYPGVYAFPVTKSKENSNLTKGLSNNNAETMYIVANIVDDSGTLEVGSVSFYDDFDPTAELESQSSKEDIEDTWDTPAVDLTVVKQVTGAKGAKDMYFQFTIQVEYPDAPDAAHDLPIVAGSTGKYESNPVAAAYGQTSLPANPSKINIGANGVGTATVWLKDGDSIKVTGLPYGTSYTVTEANTAGDPYEVSTLLEGDKKAGTTTNDIVMLEKATDATNAISDASLSATSTLTFINNKDGVNPTGIILQFGAPIAGVIIVGILFGVVFMRRRNEEDYEYDE